MACNMTIASFCVSTVMLHHFLCIFILSAGLASVAQAQAPAEERRPGVDPLGEAQQRVEFARRAREQAGARVANAESALREADAAFQAAKKEFDLASARRDAARRTLAEARSTATVAKQSYEKESAAFDRLRTRGGTGKSGR